MSFGEPDGSARRPRHLYVLGDGVLPIFKIGRSFNPVGRKPPAQASFYQNVPGAGELQVLHVEHDSGEIEQELHRRCAGWVSPMTYKAGETAEWFGISGAEGEPVDVLLRVIQETTQELGVPGKAPSNSLYTYGCPCEGCRAAHTAASLRSSGRTVLPQRHRMIRGAAVP